jgi:hypothetical protein
MTCSTFVFTVTLGLLLIQAETLSVREVVSLNPLAIFLAVYSLLLGASVLGLLSFHVYLISADVTSVEMLRGMTADHDAPRTSCMSNWKRFLCAPMPPIKSI